MRATPYLQLLEPDLEKVHLVIDVEAVDDAARPFAWSQRVQLPFDRAQTEPDGRRNAALDAVVIRPAVALNAQNVGQGSHLKDNIQLRLPKPTL